MIILPRLVLIASLAGASGCASLSLFPTGYSRTAEYETALVQVERPAATKERWGGTESIELGDSARYLYSDNMIEVGMAGIDEGIYFTIRNKTDHSIKLIWDEATFIDTDGDVAKVMHEGVRYADRNTSQPPSVIPARQRLADVAFPNDRVYYREGYYSAYSSSPGGWEHLALVQPSLAFSMDPMHPSLVTLESEANANVGKRFGLLLPLEIEGVVNEYTFWFEVKNAVVGPHPAPEHVQD